MNHLHDSPFSSSFKVKSKIKAWKLISNILLPLPSNMPVDHLPANCRNLTASLRYFLVICIVSAHDWWYCTTTKTKPRLAVINRNKRHVVAERKINLLQIHSRSRLHNSSLQCDTPYCREMMMITVGVEMSWGGVDFLFWWALNIALESFRKLQIFRASFEA